MQHLWSFSPILALRCPPRNSRPPAAVLSALGRSLQFEIAVGQNGRVWVDAPRWVMEGVHVSLSWASWMGGPVRLRVLQCLGLPHCHILL